MATPTLSFVTPYLVGADMMRLHLDAIRRFHPEAPVLVSTPGGTPLDLEDSWTRAGVRSWTEDCTYGEAVSRLLARCDTEYVCILDHDTILLTGLTPLVEGLVADRYDLVGVEERVRVPDRIWKALWPASGGWLRFAPGYMDGTLLLFNLRAFRDRWGLGGIRPSGALPPGYPIEPHYGLCQKLTRHHYLRPFHTSRYGLGNLLRNGDTDVAWHSWYGSHRARALGSAAGDSASGEPPDHLVRGVVEAAERHFLEDYPDLDWSGLEPAWWPGADIDREKAAVAASRRATGLRQLLQRIRARARRARRGRMIGSI